MTIFYIPLQCVWSLSVYISVLFIHGISCDQLFNFGLKTCEMECKCYSWRSMNTTQGYDRFTVNCTGMNFGLFQGLSIPKHLPFNTTDLVVTNYLLGTLSIKSFDNNRFPLNPQLISLSLQSCHITYISSETFNANTLQSLHHVDLNYNTIEELHENTFSFLSNVNTISVANNYIQKVGRSTFRNLYQVKLINISHNWLKELVPGIFYKVPSLEVLDLSHNWLETLPWENMSQLSSLKVLGLKGNLWNCSCQMQDILKLNRSLLIGTQAFCRYPQQLNGTLLEDLNSDAFSYCFTTKQYLETRHIITLFCIILPCLYLYYYRFYRKSDYRCIKQIRYNINDVLHRNIYRGKLGDGQEAAIKRHSGRIEVCKELRILLHLSEQDRPHPNIIRYLYVEHDEDFTYIALELCTGDLMTALMEQNSGFGDIVDPQNHFLQLASGICFLHKNGIQHRDIKPQNILWKRTVDGVALVIADFDMGHFNKEISSHKMYGTTGWSAPELLRLEESRPDAVDIFPLGCVFYFILTRGHPFGAILDPKACQRNIISPEYKVSLDLLYEHFNQHLHLTAMAEDLIRRMICSNASDRIEDHKIMKHPFLLKKEEMASFLIKIGSYMEIAKDPKVINFKDKLEENSNIVFNGKWLDKLDKIVQSDLTQYKNKGNDKICCLLTVVRNKIIHFRRLGKPELREMYGDEFGVLEYYTRLFPKLVPYTYDVLEMSEIEDFVF